MCTSIAMNAEKFCFGRNMDIDYPFGEEVVITPRNYPLRFKKAEMPEKHYSIIGMARTEENFPLYAEGANENGLCAAALKFQDNAVYSETEISGKSSIAPYELIPWVLGKCRNICEAKKLLSETNIIAMQFNENLPLSPLHWHIADKSGSLAVESTAEGLKIYDNPFGVLTNNPPFPFHSENIAQYINLSADFPENKGDIKPFGLGFGAIGLPGDFSPASRFIRAAFLLKNSVTENDAATQLFHILDSAAIPRGAVITPDKKYHFTTYSCCYDADERAYSFKTYTSSAIKTVRADDEAINAAVLTRISVNQPL